MANAHSRLGWGRWGADGEWSSSQLCPGQATGCEMTLSKQRDTPSVHSPAAPGSIKGKSLLTPGPRGVREPCPPAWLKPEASDSNSAACFLRDIGTYSEGLVPSSAVGIIDQCRSFLPPLP